MEFNKPNAEIFIPDGIDEKEALQRTTHMAVSAHQDDIEIMAYPAIDECFGKEDKWFYSIVVTNGAGSPRNGLYANYTDEEMQVIRKKEQKKAAYVGDYTAQALLDYTSSEVKDSGNDAVTEELKESFLLAQPEIVFTHNLADKHDTHVGVATKVVKALRALPKDKRPKKLYGAEVWRSLDWMMDNEKVIFDVSDHPNIANAVLGVFDSQIAGGKRYDLATSGRRIANATYAESHGVDESDASCYAMDLTPLIEDDNLDIVEYINGYMNRFFEDVNARLNKML